MVVMLRQCCCGCTLKTGTLIIGILNALGGLGNLINGIVYAGYDYNSLEYYGNGQEYIDAFETIQVIMIVILVVSAILLIVALCLIAGAVTGNPTLLLPWLVYSICYLCVNTILYIVMGSIAAGVTNGGAAAASFFVVGLIYFALEAYFILVVYSFYRELKGTAPPHA
ncbi:hypothetical protein C0J52_08603 [Blattella germanica]|nr:hypothetical protein C0J52_08603 [Blattella germanica]